MDNSQRWSIALIVPIGFSLPRVVRPDDFDDTVEEYVFSTKLVSASIGTFYLVLTVGLNILGKSPAPVFSIATSHARRFRGPVLGVAGRPGRQRLVSCDGHSLESSVARMRVRLKLCHLLFERYRS